MVELWAEYSLALLWAEYSLALLWAEYSLALPAWELAPLVNDPIPASVTSIA